jgi:tetratricopeptide (TPR) repeat protein
VGLGKLHPLARRYFSRAQDDRQALEDPAPVAYGGILEGMYHVTFGRYGRTAEKAREALRLLSGSSGAREPAVGKLAEGYAPPEVFQAEVLLGSVDFYEGRLEESLRRMTDARELARAQSNAQYEAWAELDMARGLIALDRLGEAVELLRHAQQLLAGKGDRSSELQSHGLLATAYLNQGELGQALAVADGVVELLGDIQPAMFSEGLGFEGIARVYLAAWEREGTKAPAVAKKARYACKVLARFALLFPLALPASLRCLGRAHWLAGHPRRARARWRRSLRIALRLGMPFDVALAHLELGRHAAPGSSERERHLIEAHQWLSRLGRALPPQELKALGSARLG